MLTTIAIIIQLEYLPGGFLCLNVCKKNVSKKLKIIQINLTDIFSAAIHLYLPPFSFILV